MKGKDILGTLSPVYGMATGHGLFGKDVGLLPMIAGNLRDKREEKKRKEAMGIPDAGAPETTPAMKKGGKVKKYAKGGSASKRADGCAIKGKTRGKFV